VADNSTEAEKRESRQQHNEGENAVNMDPIGSPVPRRRKTF